MCFVSFILQFWCDFSVLVNVVFLYVCQSKYRNADCFNNLKCRLYSVLSRIKNQAVLTIYAKWCKLSKYTNPDCLDILKCRLHCFKA